MAAAATDTGVIEPADWVVPRMNGSTSEIPIEAAKTYMPVLPR